MEDSLESTESVLRTVLSPSRKGVFVEMNEELQQWETELKELATEMKGVSRITRPMHNQYQRIRRNTEAKIVALAHRRHTLQRTMRLEEFHENSFAVTSSVSASPPPLKSTTSNLVELFTAKSSIEIEDLKVSSSGGSGAATCQICNFPRRQDISDESGKYCSELCENVASMFRQLARQTLWTSAQDPPGSYWKFLALAISSLESQNQIVDLFWKRGELGKLMTPIQQLYDALRSSQFDFVEAEVKNRLRLLIESCSLRNGRTPLSLLDNNTRNEHLVRSLLVGVGYLSFLPFSFFSGIFRTQTTLLCGPASKTTRERVKGRVVACRVFTGHDLSSGEKRSIWKESLYEDLLRWKNLEHINVIRLVGVLERDGGSPCILTSWQVYGNVNNHIAYLKSKAWYQRGNLLRKVHEWFYQIILGIAYLHTQGIVHGSLRGTNILIDRHEQVQISDSGLSDFSQIDVRRTHSRWLAPEVLNPEQYGMGEYERNTASDMFSFAQVVIEVLSGRYRSL
ncbi:kinase-like domain-containing protein [Abortiporus biennis]|nr:kinase-like domain-containing protein [Abortiporus biennis]